MVKRSLIRRIQQDCIDKFISELTKWDMRVANFTHDDLRNFLMMLFSAKYDPLIVILEDKRSQLETLKTHIIKNTMEYEKQLIEQKDRKLGKFP